jgi:hypothetical protein
MENKEQKDEKGSCCTSGGGCGCGKGCCAGKAAFALVLLLIGGLIGFAIGHRGYCHSMMSPCPMGMGAPMGTPSK